MDLAAQHALSTQPLPRTPLYRRDRIPETFQFFQAPQLGNININPSSPSSSAREWIVVTNGSLFKLNEQYCNGVTVAPSIWSVFENAGDGSNRNLLLTIPYMLECYTKINEAQPFRLFGSMSTQGGLLDHPLFTTIYSFRFYTYGGNIPADLLPLSNWSGVGGSAVTFY